MSNSIQSHFNDDDDDKLDGGTIYFDGTANSYNIQIDPGHTLTINGQGVNPYITFTEETANWMRWNNDTNVMDIRLRGTIHEIEPEHIMRKHPLDVGAGTQYEKEHRDLAVIRERYEATVTLNEELAAMRKDYDDLLEKYKLMDAIKGDDNAEV